MQFSNSFIFNFKHNTGENTIFEQGWGKFQFGKNFLKHESPTLNNKQNIIGKLLNINCNQSSLNRSKIDFNKNDKANEKNLKENPLKYNIDKNNNGNSINNRKPDSYKRQPPKMKVSVTGDSLIKYLRRDNLSSKNSDVKVDAHPRSTTLDIKDYIIYKKKT